MSRLQLSLSAKGLHNLAGILNKSDPFAVVTIRGDSQDNNRPMIVGETEVVYNNLSPHWSTVVFLEGYKFGVPFYIEVGVFDFQAKVVGKNERELSAQSSVESRLITSTESTRNLFKAGKPPHKVMGTALFEVGDVLGQRGNVASKSLQTGGAVYVHIERSRDDGEHGVIKFQLRGLNIANTQTLGRKASPFFELYRKVERPTGAIWSPVYRSNVLRGDLNPKWGEADLNLETVCNGDRERAMKVIVYDQRRNGKHKVIGEFESTINLFVQAKQNGGDVDEEAAFTLRKNGGSKVGNILVLKAKIEDSVAQTQSRSPQAPTREVMVPRRPEFVDYLSGGCQISLAVAIDFTASNGDPRQEGTPHYFYPPASNEWNDYQKAMFAVGSILAKYDSDQMFPVWGFGAKYANVLRHCFQCGRETNVHGVEGIMEAYRGVFNTTITMSYPTVFTEVIRRATQYARDQQELAEETGKLSYTILLILTAGDVEDAKATKQELIKASSVPLSVVIVGIGDKNFDAMEFLDDHDPQYDRGRDITKFVKFNDYRSYNLLTEAVLDEIPDQLVDYYFEKGILPGAAEQVDREDVRVMPADDDERTVNFLG